MVQYIHSRLIHSFIHPFIHPSLHQSSHAFIYPTHRPSLYRLSLYRPMTRPLNKSLLLFFLKVQTTVNPKGATTELQFSCPLQQQIVQDIPVVNSTTHDWHFNCQVTTGTPLFVSRIPVFIFVLQRFHFSSRFFSFYFPLIRK